MTPLFFVAFAIALILLALLREARARRITAQQLLQWTQERAARDDAIAAQERSAHTSDVDRGLQLLTEIQLHREALTELVSVAAELSPHRHTTPLVPPSAHAPPIPAPPKAPTFGPPPSTPAPPATGSRPRTRPPAPELPPFSIRRGASPEAPPDSGRTLLGFPIPAPQDNLPPAG